MSVIKIATLGRLSEDLTNYIDSKRDDTIIGHAYTDVGKLAGHIKNYNAFAGFSISKDLDISHLKWIHSFGAGVDKIIWNTSISEDCLITKTLGDMDKNIAEYCLAYILSEVKHILPYKISQDKKEWFHLPLQSIKGKKALIVGTGFIGKGVAKLLSSAGMTIYGLNTKGSAIEFFDTTYAHISEVDCPKISVIINTLPLTQQTENFYNEKFFNRFRGVLFINVGRGESVNDQDLIDALEKDYLSRAILDVFRKEPLPSHHSFWNHEKITVTPHIAAKTLKDEMISSFVEALKIFKNQDYNKSIVIDKSKGY